MEGSAPQVFGPAVYFDGLVARRRDVVLTAGDGLEIRAGDEVLATWTFDDLRRVASPPDRLVLRAITAAELARVEIWDSATWGALLPRCRNLDGPGAMREAGTLRIVAWSVGATVSLALVIAFLLPLLSDRLAAFVPRGVEQRIGAAVDLQIRHLFQAETCKAPDGQAALETLVGKLRAGSSRAGVGQSVEVWKTPMVNAVALPGGRIRVFDGLLASSRSVDEVAGVLAHEIGHVEHRDGLRNLIRSSGTGYLLGLFFGDIFGAGVLLGAGQHILDASYSREAETQADDHALRTLGTLGRPAKPMGEFLLRITGKQKDNPMSVLASHPASEDRLARLERSDTASGPQLLDETQWQALKNICR